MLTRATLKKIPGVSIGANIYRGAKFIKRAISLRAKLISIDKQLPFQGVLSKSGYAELQLSAKALDGLKALQRKNGVTLNENHIPVFLPSDVKVSLEEIFDAITAEVRAYLGTNAYLDGINWMISSPKYQSISGNWHTDNVGSRIKIFACVSGDGSQPTLLIPSRERIPSFSSWSKQTLVESLRWFGLENNRSISEEVRLKHKAGTIFMFDTQLLHRGGYEAGASERIIFHMEFSDPQKHQISRGPIGSKSFNSFQFSRKLLEIESFQSVLDPQRLKVTNRVCYYGDQR